MDDTHVKVIEVVLDHLAYGWNAETIPENHPHLSLAQKYAALAWYYDRQIELDAEIERQDERIRALRSASGPSNRRLVRRAHSFPVVAAANLFVISRPGRSLCEGDTPCPQMGEQRKQPALPPPPEGGLAKRG